MRFSKSARECQCCGASWQTDDQAGENAIFQMVSQFIRRLLHLGGAHSLESVWVIGGSGRGRPLHSRRDAGATQIVGATLIVAACDTEIYGAA